MTATHTEQWDLEQQLSTIDAICAESNLCLRNLKITLSYYRLSDAIAHAISPGDANWSTFATWASLTAGISIREQNLNRLIEENFKLSDAKASSWGDAAKKALLSTSLGEQLYEFARDILLGVSDEISAGNLKVYAELAPLFARFVDALRHDDPAEPVANFLASLRQGSAYEGGQDALREAFREWYECRAISDRKAFAQKVLHANCLIGLHEQTRLQPNIKRAMDRPIDEAFNTHVDQRSDSVLDDLLLSSRTALSNLFRDEWESFMTRYIMSLTLPNGHELPLGKPIQLERGTYPEGLENIDYAPCKALLLQFDSDLSTPLDNVASNWAVLEERMSFICDLFRARQFDTSLLRPPFREPQVVAIDAGIIPDDIDVDSRWGQADAN